MTSVGEQHWTHEEAFEVMNYVTDERYDAWDLVGVGGGSSPDGIDRGHVWIEKGSRPHPELLAWIEGLPYPDMVRIFEYGVPWPGDGPDVDTPPDKQGMPL